MPNDEAPGGVTRRGALKLLAGGPTIAAASGPAARRSYDEAVFFLAAHFAACVSDMARPGEEGAHLVRAANYAQAMALLPAGDPRAVAAKVSAANWSLDRGYYRIGLAAGLSADLIASASNDRAVLFKRR